MYFGHTWSPVLELAVSPPLLHGHAISVDMCFSATLANQQGLLPNVQYMRFLNVFSKRGLALDHPAFTLPRLDEERFPCHDRHQRRKVESAGTYRHSW